MSHSHEFEELMVNLEWIHKTMMKKRFGDNSITEVQRLACYLAGFADNLQNERLSEAAEWLEKLAGHMCGQGYIGCEGGEDCKSDHK